MRLQGYAQEQYLERATELVVACRKEDPLGGMWDVGDIHWWWRDGGYENPETQLFLEGENGGDAQGMILLSRQYATFDYEMRPGLEQTEIGLAAFSVGLDWLAKLRRGVGGPATVSFFIRENHSALLRAAAACGYASHQKGYTQLTLGLPKTVAKTPVDTFFEVRTIVDADFENGQPPVIRTEPSKFSRILNAPLYRRDQHLVAVSRESEVIAECLFWIDEQNAIGVFEPIETKTEFRRRGAARALLTEGLNRMNARNVSTAKLSHYTDNQPASHLYQSLGFERQFTRVVYSSKSAQMPFP